MEKGDLPICFFIDLSKAFDTLDHTILLKKLEHYGINDNALKLFKSYLTNRSQYVEYDGVKSDLLTILTGVPQGSVLGPLLFLLYMNDIMQASKIFKLILFADDTTLRTSLNTVKNGKRNCRNISEIINYELERINIWMKANKLSINIEKTKYMLFYKHNKVIPDLTFKINTTTLEEVDEFPFLGLNIDCNLSWNAHIQKISSKLNRTKGVLNKLKYTLPKNVKILLYNSFILSQINYCILAWGYKINDLTQHQKGLVRIISNKSYTAHSEPILKDLKLLKFEDLHKLNLIKFYFKYRRNELPQYFQNFEFTQNQDIHNHDTRNKSDLHTNKVKHVYADECIRNHILHFINELDQSIKDTICKNSIKKVIKIFKKHTLANYNFICTDKNCYNCKN